MSARGDDEAPESDAIDGAPHPRRALALVGQFAAEAAMLEAYREGRLAHSWLIGGPQGVGKATLAWRFARFILAYPDPSARAVREAHDLSLAPEHPAARLMAVNAHPDFTLLRREWNYKAKSFFTGIRVDDVRAGLGVFHLCAGYGGWRVAIVDSADDLNKESGNALLKMIEEPPERSLILIVAHRPGQVLPTIRSRCRRLLLEPLGAADIETVVAGLGAPWDALPPERIARAAANARGSVSEALMSLDPSSQSVGALIERAVAALPAPPARLQLEIADAITGRDAEDAFERFMLAIYDWLAAEAKKPSSFDRLETISELWRRLRAQTRDTLALNLDKRLHVLALFEEIRKRGRVLGGR